jgi:hypothetical protein
MRGPRELFDDYKLDAEMWCEDRSPWLRAALAGYLAYAGVRHILDPLYRSWFGGITLAFHEAGHLLFSGFGNTMMLLGGSLMQIAVPLFATIYLLLRQGDHFGMAVGGSWLAFASWELATYVYDAPREELPLVGFGDHPQHDWGTLLTQWHLLNHSDTFATLIRIFATILWAGSMALAAWLCLTMWRSRAA